MIINVYKPKGWTSNDVVQKIKHLYKFKKVGHAGTLDPLAEGVLIVLTDRDTKKQDEFINMKKEYRVKIALGLESDSHDLGSPVRFGNEEIARSITKDDLQNLAGRYIGKINQQVPAYSAVHIEGQRSYNLARSNSLSPAKLPVKEVEIYSIDISSFNVDDVFDGYKCTTAELLVSCSKGTYIRSLVRDIGNDLKCGGLVLELVRTGVGGYSIENARDLNALKV